MSGTDKKIRVLIVDDSALVRKLLVEMLSGQPDFEVVGTAVDPFDARDKIKALNPDVLTLDVEMPRMDGLTFLSNLMRLRPMPVVMVSSLTEKGADVTLRALELGAIDYVSKPKMDVAHSLSEYAHEIAAKLRVAAKAHIRALDPVKVAPVAGVSVQVGKAPVSQRFRTTQRLIAIGASTGGTEAIREVLQRFPADCPGIVITQHIPPGFSAHFAARLDGLCGLSVSEAKDGEPILPGHAYIAPGDHHLEVVKNGAKYHCKVTQNAPVNRHRPSVDVLFRSVVKAAGYNAVGVLLTGMGADGAEGLKELRDTGAHTIAQDERTSVVWGMPGAAVRLGAAVEVLPLHQVAERAFVAAVGEGAPGRAAAG